MDKEEMLLNELRKNSRIRVSKIARNSGIPVTTLHFNLKRLEELVILKHSSLLDLEGKGFQRYIFLIEKAPPRIIKMVEKKEFVNNLYRSQRGILVECVFRNSKQADKFATTLSNNRIKYSYHPIFSVEKQEEMQVQFSSYPETT